MASMLSILSSTAILFHYHNTLAVLTAWACKCTYFCQIFINIIDFNLYNSLPSYIKVKINDINEFKQLINNFLYCNTFHTVEEYFNYFNHNKNDNTIWMF
jgi:hypothetical protein